MERREGPDYKKSTVYRLSWSHRQDPKANPYWNFSATVNLGSSQYYRQSLSEVATDNFLNN